jgi:hypothetical protein
LDDGTEIKTTWVKKGEAMFPGAYAWSYPDKYVCKIVCDFHEGPVDLILEKTGRANNEYRRIGTIKNIPRDWFGNIKRSDIVLV